MNLEFFLFFFYSQIVSSISIQHEQFYLLLIMFAHSEVVTCIAVNTYYSIEHYSFVCAELNDSRCCYVSLTILLAISNLFTCK